MTRYLSLALILTALVISGCEDTIPAKASDILSYRIVNQYPHGRQSFTQGLCYYQNKLYEGTGRYGRSSIRRVSLTRGHVLMSRKNNRNIFGEGIAIHNNRLYQLTWKSGKCYVYDLESFKLLETFKYPGEGWGLTFDNKHLIMSDGTSKLQIRDPSTFELFEKLTVTYNGTPIDNINELEYIKGKIYANIYESPRIAIINPDSGLVENWIDLTELVKKNKWDFEAVLNGIAYDSENDRLFITGKLWSNLYEIKLEEKKAPSGY